jgi:hypothetical protein
VLTLTSPARGQSRIKEVLDLLAKAEFDFNPEAMTPTTRGLVTGRTGFLVPEDLNDFDEVVDEYINGPFYRCNYTGVELVGKLQVRVVGESGRRRQRGGLR